MAVTPLAFPTPYDNLLIQHGEHMHMVMQDIKDCKVEAIRMVNVHDLEPLLNLFEGATLSKKRDALMAFLRIMPEYKTNDQEVLLRRLKALKEQLKREGGYTDLYYWAVWRYRRTQTNENEE